MRIGATRTAAAGIAAACAVVDVVLVASAILLAIPGLAYLLLLLGATQVVVVASMLRPLTLTIEGSEVVYQGIRGAKRIPRSAIAGCKLIGSAWVFSDAAGAQLLSLPAMRFVDAEVATFCNQAGIGLVGPSLRPVDVVRADLSGAKSMRAWGIGLAIPILGIVGIVIWAQLNSQDALRRYQAAPSCQPAATVTSACRLQTQARVTSVKSYTTVADLHLTLVPGGGDHVVRMDVPTPSVGDLVEVEVWSGDITRVNARETSDNPARDPNLHLERAGGVPVLFALLALGMGGMGQYQLSLARARLRAATGSASVEKLEPDVTLPGMKVPPCGFMHQPKELFFAHEDPRTVRSAIVIVTVIAALLLAGLIAAAIYVSLPIFGAVAALLLVFYSIQLLGQLREIRFGGLFADDLHVGKVTTNLLGRFERKVYERSSVLEVVISGPKISVVGKDGSTLFWTTLISTADMQRYGEFLGCRIVRDAPAADADSIATPPVQTPMGVLPLPVRRAAGIMQAIGGLLAGLSVLNLVRIANLPADRRTVVLAALISLAAYGAILAGIGFVLARGWVHSRELAIFGGGAATAAFVVSWFVIIGNPLVAGIVGVLVVGVYGLAVYWLRPASTGGQSRS